MVRIQLEKKKLEFEINFSLRSSGTLDGSISSYLHNKREYSKQSTRLMKTADDMRHVGQVTCQIRSTEYTDGVR